MKIHYALEPGLGLEDYNTTSPHFILGNLASKELLALTCNWLSFGSKRIRSKMYFHIEWNYERCLSL
jgi:hypothetical protein